MKTMLAAAFAGLVLAAPAAETARAEDSGRSAEEMAREGVEKLMKALELLIEEIPQYEMPEITEDGDIIIRRKNPPKDREEDAPGGSDEEEPEVYETDT